MTSINPVLQVYSFCFQVYQVNTIRETNGWQQDKETYIR